MNEKLVERCPACGRNDYYHRITNNTYRCKTCGNTWKQTTHTKPEDQAKDTTNPVIKAKIKQIVDENDYFEIEG